MTNSTDIAQGRKVASLKSMPFHLAAVSMTAILAFAITTTVLWVTVLPPAHAKSGQSLQADNSSTILDVVKIGLTVVAGIGGMVALVVAYRRQRVLEDAHRRDEDVAAYSKVDTTERRNIDLYTKSIEQLGSLKAPVRLGGIYALERLAEENPHYRRVVINALCAYLRMPYDPPELFDWMKDDSLPLERMKKLDSSSPISGEPGVTTESPAESGSLAENQGAREELQVRLTVQRILREHTLNPDIAVNDREHEDRYWPSLGLDLTGAVLINLDFSNCLLTNANFSEAMFIGDAMFHKTRFDGDTIFDFADIMGYAPFSEAEFNGQVRFFMTLFKNWANFTNAHFCEEIMFNNAHFGGVIQFSGANFYQRQNEDELFLNLATASTDTPGVRHLPPGWRLKRSKVLGLKEIVPIRENSSPDKK